MTRQALALSLLEEAGPRGVTTAEFMDAGVGSRYSARLLELRKQGHRITSERVREGSWRYVLLDVEVGGVRAGTRDRGFDSRQSPGDAADLSADIPVLKVAEWLKLFESAA